MLRKRVRFKIPTIIACWHAFGCFRETDNASSLAYMESYHTIAHVFRPGSPRMSLYETDRSDVVTVRGFMFSLPKVGAQGLRVVVWDACD
jgi:hypothetical protein